MVQKIGRAGATLAWGSLLQWFSSLWQHRKPDEGDERAPSSATGALNWRDFSSLIGEAFRRQGYQLVAPEGHGADRTTDLVLRKDRQTYLVQCAQWKTPKVGVEVVHALTKALAARGAAGGFVVTSGRFSREAIAFARTSSVRLIDGPVLDGMIHLAKAAK